MGDRTGGDRTGDQGPSAAAHERHDLQAVAGIQCTVRQPRPRHDRLVDLDRQRPPLEPEVADDVAGGRTGGHFAGHAVDHDADGAGNTAAGNTAASHTVAAMRGTRIHVGYFAFAPPPRGLATSSGTSGTSCAAWGCCAFQGIP